MADEQFQEKTERATPKRQKESREKGQVPRSRELNTAAVMITASASMFALGSDMMKNLVAIMSNGLTFSREVIFDTTAMSHRLSDTIYAGIVTIAPFLGVCAAVAIAAPMLLGGWSFSTKAMAFKAEKLNPIAGLKRLFALRSAIELLKAMGKFLVVGFAAVLVLKNMAGEFLSLSGEPLRPALAHTAWLCAYALLVVSSALILIAAIDVPFQLWDHAKKLRMTRQEVRDEHKETDGQPEVKARIRNVQQEMARRRMMEQVPDADVIVTNPTHYAVALKYEEGMSAPTLVAKGADVIAHQIRKIGAASNVPLVEAPPLARALYATTDIGDQIPARLYKAVAQVLAYVYRLREAHRNAAAEPELPEIEVDEA